MSEKKKLLLVEDELLIATVEMKALEKAGFSVITAASGEEAIVKVRNTDDIDLILMDINLGPGIDGAEAATVILKERDIPLVFLSSHTEPDVVDRTESITSYGYVVKNSGITVLTASIRMAFKLHDARREIEKQNKAVEDANRKLQDLLQELEETNRELVASRTEIIESRAALVESNEKFMRIADSMPQIVWTADCTGRIDFLNDIYFAYAGEERYNSRNELMNIHPDDVEQSRTAWMSSVSTGEIFEVRQRLRRHDGKYRWFLNRGIPVFNNDNNLIKWYGTCTDIDELVIQKEERLRLEKNLLEAQRLSSTGSFEYDIIGRNFYWSDEVFNIIGISNDEFQGKASDFYRFVHPDDIGYVKDLIRRSIDERICISFEYRVIRNDNSLRYLTIRLETIFDANDKPARIIGIVQDITGHALIKKALMESEERWQFALEGAGDGLWDWNTATDEIYYSKRLKQLLGYDEDEMENTLSAWEKLIHPDDICYVLEEVDKLIRGDVDFYSTEHRLMCKDGSYKWILDRGKVIKKNSEGRPLRIIGIFTDITENILIEESLAAALEEKEALMRELQHRVKNTLTMITSLVSLELGQSDNPEVQKSLKTIEGRVMVLSNLYHILYAGEGTTGLPLDSYLKTIIGSVTSGYGDSARNISVNTDFQNIEIDPKRATSIGIILNELLTNSIKYAFRGREGGTVNRVEIR
jgi:PAS domain S-box-containing protein